MSATSPRRRRVPCGPHEHYRFPPLDNETLPFAIWQCAREKTNVHAVYGPMEEWDVSDVTVMSRLFSHLPVDRASRRHEYLGSSCLFDVDVSCWDVSNVVKMRAMFASCRELHIDVSKWDVRRVTSMSGMFSGANVESLSGLEHWKTESLENTSRMFERAHGFKHDLTKWDTSNVVDMSFMFNRTLCVSQSRPVDLSRWNTANVRSMESMFDGARISNWDVSKWSTGSVERTTNMFRDAPSFSCDLSEWDVSRVYDMEGMFDGATSFRSDLSRWDVRHVESISSMFRGAVSFDSDLSEWRTSSLRRMRSAFLRAERFTSDLSQWSVERVERADSAFFDCELVCDLSKWNLASARSAAPIFDRVRGPRLVWDVVGKTWTAESLAKNAAFLSEEAVAAVVGGHRQKWARKRWKRVREHVCVVRPAALHWLETVQQAKFAPSKVDFATLPGQLEEGLEQLSKRRRV